MTEELLEKLFTDQQIKGAGSNINAEPNESLTVTPKVPLITMLFKHTY